MHAPDLAVPATLCSVLGEKAFGGFSLSLVLPGQCKNSAFSDFPRYLGVCARCQVVTRVVPAEVSV